LEAEIVAWLAEG